MFEYIKNQQRKRIFDKMKMVERHKKIVNINNVRTIGIVFKVEEKDHWILLSQFAKIMEEAGKKVMMIGLQDAETEISYIIAHSNTFICHEKEDLDRLGFPKGSLTDHFCSQHFDLLIDTTDEPNFFGQYIALSTSAYLKVTYSNTAEEETEDDIFDLIIRGEGKMDLRDYLNHIVRTLNMIQK